MAELTVTVYTHHFVVRRVTPRARPAVEAHAKKYVQYGLERLPGGRFVYAAQRVYAASTQNRSEYRFHLNTLSEFKTQLEFHALKGDLVEWEEAPIPVPRKVELPVFPQWIAREDQVPVIDYIESYEAPRSKFVNSQTGKGKSFCSLKAISNLGLLPMVIIRPMYIDKWIIDIRKTYDIAIEDMMVVQGSEHLQMLLMLAEADQLQCKLIIMSNKTLQNWLKLYERFGEETTNMGYACTPDRMFELLGVGFRLIDEVHQDFHLNFRIDLYSHVVRSASLSATLVSDDGFMNKMYEVAYPAASRYKGAAYDKYIAARAVVYRAREPNKLRTKNFGSKTYSHHAFEKSIIRNASALNNYLRLIDSVIKNSRFGKQYKSGDKLLVYCASVELCTIVTKYLQDQYSDMKVRRYAATENDPYEDLMESDIRVTTIQSAGTGVDIPGLVVTILTLAIASSQGNIQGFGRLRKLADNTAPEFYYFVCEDIPKHVMYHERKRDLLKDMALNYKAEFVSQPI